MITLRSDHTKLDSFPATNSANSTPDVKRCVLRWQTHQTRIKKKSKQAYSRPILYSKIEHKSWATFSLKRSTVSKRACWLQQKLQQRSRRVSIPKTCFSHIKHKFLFRSAARFFHTANYNRHVCWAKARTLKTVCSDAKRLRFPVRWAADGECASSRVCVCVCVRWTSRMQRRS